MDFEDYVTKKLLVAPSLWVHQKYHKEKLVYS